MCILLFLMLAHFALYLDHTLNLKGLNWLWNIQSLQGAHDLLYAVAASMYTFVASTFTISIAALSFASRDMGPRLLEDFSQDWRSQLTLGVLLGTFSFNLWAIAALKSTPEGFPVPVLTVNVGLLLAYLSVGFLVMFIDQMTQAMNITTLVNRLGKELQGIMMEVSSGLPPIPEPETPLQDPVQVYSTSAGNLYQINLKGLAQKARVLDAVVVLKIRPGQYVFPGMVIGETSKPLDLTPFLDFSDYRKTPHDPESAIRQLNEIAVRSMESGIKDPFTVITCIDRMGSALCLLKNRNLHSGVHLDQSGEVRVMVPTVGFGGLMDEMFHQIRQFGKTSPAIMIRLLEVLGVVMSVLDDPEHQQHIFRHLHLVREDACRELSGTSDLKDIEQRFEEAVQHFKAFDREIRG